MAKNVYEIEHKVLLKAHFKKTYTNSNAYFKKNNKK